MLRRTEIIVVFLLVLLGGALSFLYILSPELDFDADEAVVGLMALHITQGHIPAYFYGQGYMGSLEALLASIYFLLFGVGIFPLKLAPLSFFVLFLIFQYKLIRDFGNHHQAVLTLLLSVIFSPTITLWATKARGGFTGTLLWGTLAYYFFFKIMDNYFYGKKGGFKWVVFLGLTTGVGFWNCALIVYYYLPIIFFLIILNWLEIKKITRQSAVEWKAVRTSQKTSDKKFRIIFKIFFCALAVYILSGFLAIIFNGFMIRIGEITIRSHNGIRDIGRGLAIALLALIFLGIKELGGKKFVRLTKRYLSALGQNPYLKTIATVAIIYLLITGSIDIYFHNLPDYEFGHYRPFHLITEPDRIGSNIAYTFSRLLPKVTPISSSSNKLDLGKTFLSKCCSIATAFLIIASITFIAFRLVLRLNLRNLPGTLVNLVYQQRIPVFFIISFLSCLGLVCLSSLIQDSTSFRYYIPVISWLPFFLVYLSLSLWQKNKIMGVIIVVTIIFCLCLKLSPILTLYREYFYQPAAKSNYRKIIEELNTENITRAFADYWLAYPLTFLTQENIIVAPFLSHERYPPYTTSVKESKMKAFIFEDGAKVIHLRRLEKGLIKNKVRYRKKKLDWGVIFIVYE